MADSTPHEAGTPSDTTTNTSAPSGVANDSPSPPNGSTPQLMNGLLAPSPSSSKQPVTMPLKRQEKLEQMLWHSLMEAKGEIVAVSTTSGETYSGILFAIEANSRSGRAAPSSSSTPGGDSEGGCHPQHHAAWNKIVLKYVQKMSDPNANPADRIKAEYSEEISIPAAEFAALSAIAITDHSNSYRRADRQAFNDASGRTLHRKERELVRWAAASGDEAHELLDDDEAPGQEPYDQFAANNVEDSFDEAMYTSNLDKSHPEYARAAKEAAASEDRIMSQEVTNKHRRGDRAYYSQSKRGAAAKSNGDDDEEDAFSRVISKAPSPPQPKPLSERGSRSYVPPQLRGPAAKKGQKKGAGSGSNVGSIKELQKQREAMHKRKHREHDGPQRRKHSAAEPNGGGLAVSAAAGSGAPVHPQHTPLAPQQQQQPAASALLHHHHPPQQQQQKQQQQQMQLLQLQQFLHQAQGAAPNPSCFTLPPHIAGIVKSVTMQQREAAMPPQSAALSPQQQLGVLQNYQQQLNSMVIAARNQSTAAPLAAPSAPTGTDGGGDDGGGGPNGPSPGDQTEPEGAVSTGDGQKDGDLNPNAIEFTPQIAARQTSSALQQHTQRHLALQQQQAATLMLGQPAYSFNPATGQYVLGIQQPLGLQQQHQHFAQNYLQHLALQQAAATQQNQMAVPNGQPSEAQKAAQQQLLAAQHQFALQTQQQQQQQIQLQAQAQAQATGLNLGAPLFSPSQAAQSQNAQQLLLQQHGIQFAGQQGAAQQQQFAVLSPQQQQQLHQQQQQFYMQQHH